MMKKEERKKERKKERKEEGHYEWLETKTRVNVNVFQTDRQ
jgi:hypothetical protein